MNTKNQKIFSVFTTLQGEKTKHKNNNNKIPSSFIPRSKKGNNAFTASAFCQNTHLFHIKNRNNNNTITNTIQSVTKGALKAKNSTKCINKSPIHPNKQINLELKYINNIIKTIPFKSINFITTPCTAKHSRQPSEDNNKTFNNQLAYQNNYKKNDIHCGNIKVLNIKTKSNNISAIKSKLKQSQSSSLSKIKDLISQNANDFKGLLNKISNLTSQNTTKQNIKSFYTKTYIKQKNKSNSSQLSKSFIKQSRNENNHSIHKANIKQIQFNIGIFSKKNTKISIKRSINNKHNESKSKKENSKQLNHSNNLSKNNSILIQKNEKKCHLSMDKSLNIQTQQITKLQNFESLMSRLPFHNTKNLTTTNTNINIIHLNHHSNIKKSNSKKSKIRNLSLNNNHTNMIEEMNLTRNRNNYNALISGNFITSSYFSNQDLSTSRESNYYKNESKKLSEYIMKYHNTSKTNNYPKTTIKFYHIGRRIGNGAFGKVNIGLHILSGHIVAVKSFNKHKQLMSKSRIMYELKLMKKIRNHKNIVKLLEYVETNKHICIIMENIPGGNLLSLINKRIKLPEKTSQFIFKQLIEALKYIHSQGIAHRDIKPDNILIDLNNTIKLCDFGVGKEVKQGELLTDTCGTPAFVAPEILKDSPYDPFQTDVWSSGVVLYSMLTGVFPFRGNNDEELHKSILNGKFAQINDLSYECNDLLNKILEVNPKKRFKIEQILEHEWMKNIYDDSYEVINLFTNAERIIYSKLSLDYRFAKKEDLVENFTYKNLNSSLENQNQNAKTRSIIITPPNTALKGMSYEGEEMYYQDLKIEDSIMRFAPKINELNLNYERDFNEEADMGIVKDKRKVPMGSLNNSIESKERDNSPLRNVSPKFKVPSRENDSFLIDKQRENPIGIAKRSKKKDAKDTLSTNYNTYCVDENAVRFVEQFGYGKDYIIKSIENNEINHATATYYLRLSIDNEEK